MKKKASQSKAAKSVRSLPAKALSAKTAKGVKGGGLPRGVTRRHDDESPKE